MHAKASEESGVWQGVLFDVMVGGLLLGIAAFGMEVYGSWRICAWNAVTIPQISAMLFGVGVGRGSVLESPWLSLPVIGVALLLVAEAINYGMGGRAHATGPWAELRDTVWDAVAPSRTVEMPRARGATWRKGAGPLYGGYRDLCGLGFYYRALFGRIVKAFLVIRLIEWDGETSGHVQFAVDFWRRGHETKCLWTSGTMPVKTALSLLAAELDARVHELVQAGRGGSEFPADWVSRSFIDAHLPEMLKEIRPVLWCAAGVCATILLVGLPQAVLAHQYHWSHWSPFGGFMWASALAAAALGSLWSTREVTQKPGLVRRRLYAAASLAVIAIAVLLPSIYFLVKVIVLLAPQCAQPVP